MFGLPVVGRLPVGEEEHGGPVRRVPRLLETRDVLLDRLAQQGERGAVVGHAAGSELGDGLQLVEVGERQQYLGGGAEADDAEPRPVHHDRVARDLLVDVGQPPG